MRFQTTLLSLPLLLCIAVVCSACKRDEATAPPQSDTATQTTGDTTGSTAPIPSEKNNVTPDVANEKLDDLAERERKKYAALTFEEFKTQVYREPFEGGKYIVNGDTAFVNEKQLREFFDRIKSKGGTDRLILGATPDAKWNHEQQKKITYCVSNTFGSRKNDVVKEMEKAGKEWERYAAVDFIYEMSQDANCTASNSKVVFDVRPVNVDEEYLARAFFPNDPRISRNVLIDESSFNLDPPPSKLQLGGILRHELGHTLGWRHEHTRPEAGKCFEDNDWTIITDYDGMSVMHYPQCNGLADWSLNLSPSDKNGAACVYGPAAGFTIDETLVKDKVCVVSHAPAAPGQPKTATMAAQSVAQDARKSYGPFAVAPGTLVEASMGGPNAKGDPDLYLRFDFQPSTKSYDCRPYLDGPEEACALTVPANASRVFVMVRGYQPGAYDLRVTHTQPAQ